MIELLDSYSQQKDLRGSFFGIVNKIQWEEINLIHSYRGSKRGGHFHKKSKELFFILEGKIEIKYKKVISKNKYGELKKLTVKKNDIFIIHENIHHEFKMIEKSTWINALSKKYDKENPDFHY